MILRLIEDVHKVRSFYCSAVDFILYMLALCFWTNQLFIAIIRFIIITIITTITNVIITRPWPAFGRQGLDGTSFNW